MYFKQLQDEVSYLAMDTSLSSTGNFATRSKAWLNEAYFLEILPRQRDWWFLRKYTTIQSVAEYATGTVALTQGSKTVTGTGTTFVAAHASRKLVINNHSYKIATYNSGTSLTLDKEFEEPTVSGASYTIVQDVFELPGWLDPKTITEFRSAQVSKDVLESSQIKLNRQYPGRSAVSDPKFWVPGERRRNTYSTGTVSGTIATKTLTGSSTLWSTNDVQQFDKIQVGSYVYTVDVVNSDTSITLFENLVATISGGTSYTALMDRYTVELYPIPKDLRTYYITGQQYIKRLDDDSDVPLLPDEWHYLLARGAAIKAMKHLEFPRYRDEIAEYRELISQLIKLNRQELKRLESWELPR